MRITVLGKSPAWQDAGGACSGYLVEHEGFTLLLDCGSGVFGELRRQHDYTSVDAVLITHIHADHWLDLIPFSHALTISPSAGRRATRPRLWVAPGMRAALRGITAGLGDAHLLDDAFEAGEYDPAGGLALGPLRLRFAEVPHYVRTFAVDIAGKDAGRFTFGADCGPNEALPALGRDTELLIVEATLRQPDAPPGGQGQRGHMTAREAGEMGARAGAGRVLLTHFSDELDAGWIRDEAAAGFGAPVEMAQPGMVVTLSRYVRA